MSGFDLKKKTLHKNNLLQTFIKIEINNFKLYMKPVYSSHYANLSNRKNSLWYDLADFVVFRLVWVFWKWNEPLSILCFERQNWKF